MVCGKLFVSQRTYDAHMDNLHTSDECPQKFTCSLCEGRKKVYHRNGLLESHMKRDYKETEFKCILCNKEFKKKGALTEHERHVHFNQRYESNRRRGDSPGPYR